MRIRTIKPEFWSSPDVAALTYPARLTFIGLWNYADDEGRGVRDARLVKSAVWPLDDEMTASEIEQHLQSMEARGMLASYTVGSRHYFEIPSWFDHQAISKPTESKIPEPLPEGSLSLLGDLPDGSGSEQGRERNREQGTGIVAQRFEDFWATYPRKVGKRKAFGAFKQALRRADAATITAGAERYRDDPNRELAYTAHPTTWLNRDGWSDDPLPARNGKRDNAAEILRKAVSHGATPGRGSDRPAAELLPGA